MKKYTKGFTLIELLVVIAIIGILSSVVLVSLNTARSKGQDAAVQGNLQGLRAQAELVAGNGDYSSVCANSNFINALASAETNGGGTTGCVDGSGDWAAYANYRTNASLYYCVDSAGNATSTTSVPSDTDGSRKCQ